MYSPKLWSITLAVWKIILYLNILKCSFLASKESSSDSDQPEEDIFLSFQHEITNTIDALQPFEMTEKPRRRKRKDKANSSSQDGGKLDKEGNSLA